MNSPSISAFEMDESIDMEQDVLSGRMTTGVVLGRCVGQRRRSDVDSKLGKHTSRSSSFATSITPLFPRSTETRFQRI